MIMLAVCIASVGRPTLVDCLHSILLQEQITPGCCVRVYVADDSLDGAAQRIVNENFQEVPKIRVVTSQARNIATARNKLLEAAAAATMIAFIDDDEIADANWLRTLMDALQQRNLDVVFGPVEPIRNPNIPDWIFTSRVYSRALSAGRAPLITGYTSNVLFRAEILNGAQVAFDERFGRTGGEDTDFFFRLGKAGVRLGASDEGFVREHIPPRRWELNEIRRRYIRGGQTYAQLVFGDRGGPWVALAADVLAKLIIFRALGALVAPVSRPRQIRYMVRYWANCGKLRYLLGLPLEALYQA